MGIFLLGADADTAFPGALGDDGEPRHQRLRIIGRQQAGLGKHARVGSAADGVVDQQYRIQLRVLAHGETVYRLVQEKTLGPELCTHAACSLDFASRITTMVPLPWLVKTSVSTASGSTPLTRCALA